MRNKITDLNNHLFAQLERLSDEDLNHQQIELETARAKAICSVSQQIVDSSRVTVDAMKIMDKSGVSIKNIGENLIGGDLKTIGE